MLKKSTLEFLIDLELNNNKIWFDANRPRYESARDDVLAFAGGLIERIASFDAAVARAQLQPKYCISRIYRDTRFSKDKRPYKANFFIIVAKNGKSGVCASYYLQIEPGKSFAGGGIYCPPGPELNRIRKVIDANPNALGGIVDSAAFRKTYADGIRSSSILTRVPKGFAPESPAAEMLKRKDYYAVKELPDSALTGRKSLDDLAAIYKTAQPLIEFINDALAAP